MPSRVAIIGAGPGNPELLTLKAYRLLRRADAIVYDRLVAPEALALARRGAVKIYAGKSCKSHAMTQEEINATLLALARKKKLVVRLKGGDPFIFGRGGEEAEFLARHNIAFEIVPGITSAQGCAAYAGIPLTHRGLASSVRFITGHKQKSGELNLNWQSLADSDTTLVFYMALGTLEMISERLIAAGLPADTPAAAVQDGTLESQRRILGSLQTIAEKVRAAALEPPALLIVGRVVGLAGALDWFAASSANPAKCASSPGRRSAS